MGLRVGVVGATGMVGRVLLAILAERNLDIGELRPMASSRRAGRTIEFGGNNLEVIEATPRCMEGLDIVLFSAGARASRELAPAAVAAGAVVVDNSSAWRLEPGVPLVVPEVNPSALEGHRGIIANPNCCTIPLTMVLRPISELSPLRRVLVDTYQSASGAGWKLVEELNAQRRALAEGSDPTATAYPHVLEGNVVPGGWSVDEDGHTEEELKIVAETRKILALPDLAIACTTVRVPVEIGHSEAVWIETEAPLDPTDVRARLSESAGVVVRDEPSEQVYPLARAAAGTDQVHVGRVRRDLSHPNGTAVWLAADNLRKGAATNAVQIAELLF